jgi:hypothetical protein
MAMVKVGCKLTHGFIMEIVTQGPMNLPAPAGERVEIKGANSLLVDGMGRPITDGFAFTDVPEELAKEWFRVNANTKMVKNGFVIMQSDKKSIEAQAKEHVAERTGLEALNPDRDPRSPKNVKPYTKNDKPESAAA